MMSVWILILVLGGSGKAIDHVEFRTKASCDAAIEAVKAEIYFAPSMVCVENPPAPTQ